MQWILIGAILGALVALDYTLSVTAGALLGALGGLVWMRSNAGAAKIDALIREQGLLQKRIRVLESHPGQVPESTVADDEEFQFELDPSPAASQSAAHEQAVAHTDNGDPWRNNATRNATVAADGASGTRPFGPQLQRVWHFFTTGNVVARVGSVVLFFGLAFLLKHAADRLVFPVELRLAGIAVLGLGLLGVGWYLRRRQGYGLILQGAGIGTLYLTIFAALRLYSVLPHGLAFGLMIAVVAAAAGLALLQDSRALVSLGTAGGFMAPILTSSGDGSHVLLFSYYALLNAGIVAIAWQRSWRSLNLLGFGFTFIIGAIWGHQAYRPELFTTTQPFLALFFLFYLVIPILFAQRQPPRLNGYLDGTLVFGVPLAGFALQAALVERFEFGLAYSAVAVAVVYLGFADGLRRRKVANLALITRVYALLGACFATLAIPFAFDNRITAGVWAMEGAALIWLGVRERRRFEIAAGVLLQVGAGCAFILAGWEGSRDWPLLNGVFLGTLILSLSGFWSALQLERTTVLRDDGSAYWRLPSQCLLGWGLFWWLAGGLGEAEHHLRGDHANHASVVFLALSALALERLSRRLQWQAGGYPAIGLLPLLALIAVSVYSADLNTLPGGDHLLSHWGALAWLVAGAVHLSLLRDRQESWPARLIQLWHMGGLWLLLMVLSTEAAWLSTRLTGTTSAWSVAAWALAPVLALSILTRATMPAWPVARFPRAYRYDGLLPVAGLLTLWVLLASFARGEGTVPAYLPLLNPIELTQAAVVFVLFRWWLSLWREQPPFGASPLLIPASIGACGFIALNGVVARAAHFLGNVPHSPGALFASTGFQSGLSILWTTLALTAMAFARRRRNRGLWYVGAALLGLVVIKLFLVELANAGTIGRIISFLAVGLLMLLIGFLSPLPPSRAENAVTDPSSKL